MSAKSCGLGTDLPSVTSIVLHDSDWNPRYCYMPYHADVCCPKCQQFLAWLASEAYFCFLVLLHPAFPFTAGINAAVAASKALMIHLQCTSVAAACHVLHMLPPTHNLFSTRWAMLRARFPDR